MRAEKVSYSDVRERGVAVNFEKTKFFLNKKVMGFILVGLGQEESLKLQGKKLPIEKREKRLAANQREEKGEERSEVVEEGKETKAGREEGDLLI